MVRFTHKPRTKRAKPSIRNSALRAIHNLDLSDAMPELAAEIERSFVGAENPAAVPANHRDQSLHNRLIYANFRLGKTNTAERLLKYAASAALPALNREQAHATRQEWPAPTIVDAVTAQYRPLDPATRDDISESVRSHLGPVLADAESPLLTRGLQVAVQCGAEIPAPLLGAVLKNFEADTELRVQSIKSLAKSDPDALDTYKCRTIGKTGGIAGPELTDIGTREKAADILESLINPSAIIVPGYVITILTLKDGTSIGATLLEESDTELTLKSPDGSIQKIAATDIATRQSPMSAMSPIIALLKKREIRDLVAYLGTLKDKPATGH